MTSTETDARSDNAISQRMASEKAYHESFYKKRQTPLEVDFDLALSAKRRPHNLAWAYYDTILNYFHGDLTGQRFLVVGCGEGTFALNLARNGATVDAFDLSEEAIAICKRRAEYHGITGANFFVSSCEDLAVADGSYDAVVGELILHHIDIPTAVQQFHRLLKREGLGVFMEWKAYPIVDRIRSSPLLRRIFPPGGREGYATEYERKLSRADFDVIRARFPDMQLDYRYCMVGKIQYFSMHLAGRMEKVDYGLLRAFPFLRWFTDGVIIRFTKQ